MPGDAFRGGSTNPDTQMTCGGGQSGSAGTSDQRPLPRALVALSLALPALAALWALLHRFYHDDAYIALAYARNLLAGHGLVWNPGERVEGYTSLLWVLGCAGLGRAGLDLELASRLLGVVSLLALLVVLAWREGRAGAWTCLLLCTTGPLVAWSIGGLETVGFSVLLTVSLLIAERLVDAIARGEISDRGSAKRPAFARLSLAAGLLFAVSELCRPEAFLFAALAAAMMIAVALRPARDPGAGLFLAGLLIAGFAVVFVPRLAWRLHYYGDLLPNTFHVKTGSGHGASDLAGGLRYVLWFAVWFPGAALLPVAALWTGWRKRPLRAGERMVAASLIVYLAYVAWLGGDHMQWFRFLVPALPLAFLLSIRRLEDASCARGGKGRLCLMLIASVAAANLVSTSWLAVRQGWLWRDPAARSGALVGEYIRDHWPQDALVALNTAGSTAYFSQRRCIDMLGLNDRRIARRRMPEPPKGLPWARLPGHHKGDGAYVLSRQPDFIILGGSEGYAQPWFAGDLEVYENPEFQAGYAMRETLIPGRDATRPLRFRYYERTAPRTVPRPVLPAVTSARFDAPDARGV